jgi:hypothetical protein
MVSESQLIKIKHKTDSRRHFVPYLKRTGTRDYNWLKAVWYDGPRLGESPADIQKFFNCPFNFILN